MASIQTDVIIVGAGPVALYQCFVLGLQQVRCHLIDVLPHPGGQCIELYPNKPIYDLPGLPKCSGQTLVDALLDQIQPFDPTWSLGHLVTDVKRLTDGNAPWQVTMTPSQDARPSATHIEAPNLIIATGVGAFLPKRLKLQNETSASSQQGSEPVNVHHHFDAHDDLRAWRGLQVLVAGDDNHALDAALRLTQAGADVTLLHRRDQWSANDAMVDAMRQTERAGRMRLVLGVPVQAELNNDAAQPRWTALLVTPAEGPDQRISLDAAYILLGLSPRLGPMQAWSTAMAQKHWPVDPATMSTSEPGLYAIGDINHYPGKRKLLVCGFHEATLAAYAIAQARSPEQAVPLIYTTTNSRLQRLLGSKGLA